MSLGYQGISTLVEADSELALYTYAGENWNDGGQSQKGDAILQEGILVIRKKCLEEPEIHVNERKRSIKRN